MLKPFLIPAICTFSFSLSAYEPNAHIAYTNCTENQSFCSQNEQPCPILRICNTANEIDLAEAHFYITGDYDCESIWWQISSSADFSAEKTIENVCQATNVITPTDLEKAALNEETVYYFRARAGNDNSWGGWSDAFIFKSIGHAKEFNDQQWLMKRVTKPTKPQDYIRNPHVSEELWNTLSPYFVPENSPEKAALDKIFGKRRVLSSIKSMVKSGFILLARPKDKIIVAKHPYLKGYLIKAYTDTMDFPDFFWWKKRIDGVRVIQQKIVEYGYEGIMKTPQKWIYPLPAEPSPREGAPFRKNFILLVQEMDILDHEHNLKAYKNKMTPPLLDALFTMLINLQLIDSIYADNTPFCKDGKLAFIDTEHSLDTTRPVPITIVANYLSRAMYLYWEQLVVHGGPQNMPR